MLHDQHLCSLKTKSKSCFLRLLCFLAVFDTGALLDSILNSSYIIGALCGLLYGCDFLSTYLRFTILQPFDFVIRSGRWLTVAISMERFLGICYPLKFLAKYRKSWHFVIPVLLITVLDTLMLLHSPDRMSYDTIPFTILPIMIIVSRTK